MATASSSTRPFLSFNPELEKLSMLSDPLAAVSATTTASGGVTAEDAACGAAAAEEMLFQHRWHVWEQLEADSTQREYTENMMRIATFATVRDFWDLWPLLPQPSQLMTDKRMVRETEDGRRQMVDAIMIFRDGVKPMWEDPANQMGGHFEIRYTQNAAAGDPVELARLDEHWNNLVLSVIGGTLAPPGVVTGVRLVDKIHSNGRGGFIRIEVWFSEERAPNQRQELKDAVERALTTRLDGAVEQPPSGGRLSIAVKQHHQQQQKKHAQPAPPPPPPAAAAHA